ncbi:MAG: hypothetical protein KDC53_07225 [Saprospiraceae bacterium]|nr:hypothetical protein [Saprospiraceae bacterium]
MRIRHLSSLVIMMMVTFTISCDNAEKDSIRDEARSSLRDIPAGSITPPASTGNALSAAGSVQHYICPNNCQGSGGASAGTCPVCGSEYQHNQAYHTQQAANQGATQSPSTSTTPEPAQNAAGVWHYTCPNGCSGGAGSAGKCASCGGDLAHNTAYHN